MKVSIITSTYNSAATLRDTFESIRNQDHSDIDYIVVDGGSTDDTISIIEDHQHMISNWVSEPDKGIYDALNKGLEMAKGEIIGILHSDDLFAYASAISDVAAVFSDEKIDACYADLDYVDRDDTTKVIRRWSSNAYQKELFYRGWMPAHPTFFMRAKCFKSYGKYDLSFFTAADYELMLRMLFKHDLKAAYISKTLVHMRVGGQSNVTWKNRWIANQEDARAWKVNGIKPKFYTRWLKPISKLGQFIRP